MEFDVSATKDIYVLGGQGDLSYDGRMKLWRLEKNGDLTALAVNIGIDAFAASIDPETNLLYHTHLEGIDRIKLPD